MNQAVAEKMGSQSSCSMAQTPHGSSTDLRSWLRAVEQMGEIRTVEGTDWNLELGAIAELNTRLKPTPALMFDNIKDYPAGYRILTASTAGRRRLLLTLRMPTDLDDCAFAEALVGKPNQWEQESSRFAPTFVTNGPILENVIDSNINRRDVGDFHPLRSGNRHRHHAQELERPHRSFSAGPQFRL